MYDSHGETTGVPARHATAAGASRRRGLLRRVPGLRRLLARTARLLLVAVVSLLWLAAGAVAAQAPVEWHRGLVTNDTSASWWHAEIPDGLAPEVTSDYGVRGVHYWSFCPAPAYEPQTCIVQATGPWTKVTANGVTLWERGRVFLPVVMQ
jgi:hypothetical protein